MKVKKRQYRSKRGRPLKKSKTKSKAKKGSKRRVKKMRGGFEMKIEVKKITCNQIFGDYPKTCVRYGASYNHFELGLIGVGVIRTDGQKYLYIEYNGTFYIVAHYHEPLRNELCSDLFIPNNEYQELIRKFLKIDEKTKAFNDFTETDSETKSELSYLPDTKLQNVHEFYTNIIQKLENKIKESDSSRPEECHRDITKLLIEAELN